VSAGELEGAAASLLAGGGRFADLFGTTDGDELTLRLVFALDGEGRYVVVEAPVRGTEYADLSKAVPAAFLEQCELFERHGVRPPGTPLNRVLMPPHAKPGAGWSEAAVAADGRTREPHHVRGEAFEFPFGPVRVAGWETLYMGLVTTGEEVLDLYLFYWHKHRGVERRLIGLEPERALFFVERLEGLSAVANGLAFCRAVETAAGIPVNEEAACSRAVAIELERIYNHAAAIAALCQTTGLSVGQAQAEIALERLLRLNLAAFGHRYLFGSLALGGVCRAPDDEAIRRELPAACDELRRVVAALLATNSHVDRLEACGIVDGETARRLSLVGPVARASGCDIDTRRDHPFPPYDNVVPVVPVRATGDAYARMQVFVGEIDESQRIVEELLGHCGEGRCVTEAGPSAALGWAESPRGETLAWVELDESGLIREARLRPAAVRNWRAFDDAARARNVFTDIPIIEASFWQTVAGFAR